MPAPVTVWAVDLVHGSSLEGVEGSLALEGDALVFSPRAEADPRRRYPLASIVKVRRLWGSPVLMVHRADGARTAFYFVPPPPLERSTEDRRALGPGWRDTKRRARKRNAGYLGVLNKEKKATLIVWERAVREAAGR